MALSTLLERQMPTCGLLLPDPNQPPYPGPSKVLLHTLGSCLSILSTRLRTGVEYRVGTGGYLP